ncbi:SNF2 family N-terminal domain-containing protein [Neocallimastix sp. 'constans']|jgi:ATP-dependent helicase STH1/SNF2
MYNSNQQPQHIQQLYQHKQSMQQLPQQNFQGMQNQNGQNFGNSGLPSVNNLLQQQFMQNMQPLQSNIQNMGVNPVLGMPMNNLRYSSNIPQQPMQQQFQSKVMNNSNQPILNQRPLQTNVNNISSPQVKNQNMPYNQVSTETSPIVSNDTIQNQSIPQYTPEQIKQLITTAQNLSAKGETNDPEYIKICQILRGYSKMSQMNNQNQKQPGQVPLTAQKPIANSTTPSLNQPNEKPNNIPAQVPTPGQSQPQPSLQQLQNQPQLQTTVQLKEQQDKLQYNQLDGKANINENISPQQAQQIKYQVYAYKLMSEGKPVPENLQRIVFDGQNRTSNYDQVKNSEAQLKGNVINSKTVNSSNEIYNKNQENLKNESNKIPYKNPHDLMKSKIKYSDYCSRQHRILIPSIMPVGVDIYSMIKERERKINSRIQYRINELESLPSNISNQSLSTINGIVNQSIDNKLPINTLNNNSNNINNSNNNNNNNNRKLKAIIELKALKLLSKQKKLRSEVLRGMIKATTFLNNTDRASYRRMKKQSLKEARITEKLERQQRIDREKRERQNFADYLNSIITHGRELRSFHDKQQSKANKLGLGVQRFHKKIENEEAQRLAKLSQERLRALKEDDEEAYLKLIDQTKDTRITYLLQQTNEYLENLTKAVVTQQEEIGQDQPPLPEDTFGLDDDKKADYYNISHRVKEIITEQPSILTGGTLKEYQLKGLQWMVSLYNNRLNGILADEMGLGKTIQTISLISYLIEKKHQNGPFLIIVPLSTLTNWSLEFDKWAPSIVKVVYKGAPSVRKAIQYSEIRHGNFNVVLTTYEYIIKDRPVLSKIKWIHIIIDEGHRLKNAQSKLTVVLTQYYQCRYRLILTGTPLQNNLPELWALLNFLLPKIFNSVKSFDEWFNSPFATQVGEEKIQLNEEEQLLIIRRLHKVLRPFLLRRLKKDVEHELPDKVELVIKCRMSALQRRLYEKMRQKGILFTSDGKHGIKGLNNTVMQLRKIVNHPFVFEEVENSINPSGLTNELIYRTSGKFELLDRILPKFLKTNHRVLIFFQMTAIMNIMEDFLMYRGFRHLRLDGSTKSEERSDLLKKFNAENSPYMIFLLSTRAGGLGLNLQSADTVIIFDSDWNPHQDLQAQDRAHRIGQTKEVRILRLITADSIEEKILARAQYKLDIDGKVIQAGKFDNKSTAQEREALLRQLIESSSGEANDVQNEENMTDDDLNDIIHRNDEEMEIFRKMDQERIQRETEYWKSQGHEGPLPDRLIQEWELPKVYTMDEEEIQKKEEKVDYGRGQRVRKEVHYDDGLNEEQWLQALENEDLEEVIERKRQQRKKRAERKAKKLLKLQQQQQQHHDSDTTTNDLSEGETNQSDNPSIATPEVEPVVEVKHRRRGRPSRGRGRKASSLSRADSDKGSTISTTSSLVGDALSSNEAPIEKPRRGRGRRKANLMEDAFKKRKKADLNAEVDRSKPDKVGKAERLAMTRLFEACYNQVENSKDEDGRRRCELFLEVPSKKQYPDYYILIEKPIALDIINTRIHSTYYDTVQDFINDFRLMFSNARKYNQENSWVYNDSIEMEKDMDLKLDELYKDQKLIITDEDREEERKFLEQQKANENNINSLKRPPPSEENNTTINSNNNAANTSSVTNENKPNENNEKKEKIEDNINNKIDKSEKEDTISDNNTDNIIQPPSRKKQKRSEEDDDEYKDVEIDNDYDDEDNDY